MTPDGKFIVKIPLGLRGLIKRNLSSLCHAKVRTVKLRTYVMLIITRITAIADLEQRWRQRGKTGDCSFKQRIH